MIVDSHLHLFRHGYRHFGSGISPLGKVSDVDAYDRARQHHNIAAGLVVCYESQDIDPTNNTYVRSLAADRPWIHSVAYLRPAPSPTRQHIESLIEAGHCGIALYLPNEAEAAAVIRWPAEVWQLLSDAQAIVSLNARPEATMHLRPLIERSEKCTFMFSHMGLPGRHDAAPTWSLAAERLSPLLDLAHLPNVAVKLSGLYAIDPRPAHPAALPFMDLLLERFDASDLHWGSDFSPVLEFVQFEQTLRIPKLAALSAANRVQILGEGLSVKLLRAGRRKSFR